MQVNTTSLPSAAQILGPTTRAATSRADGGTVTRHVAAPVGDSAGQSVESLRSIRLAARYDRPTGRVVTRVIDESNGEVVHQIPDDDALRLLVGIREMVGIVVDESA
ncbi:MAG: flagellar protein FlaG [Alphaproteobacteria bacterium]